MSSVECRYAEARPNAAAIIAAAGQVVPSRPPSFEVSPGLVPTVPVRADGMVCRLGRAVKRQPLSSYFCHARSDAEVGGGSTTVFSEEKSDGTQTPC